VTPYYEDDSVTIYHGDCREITPTLPDAQFDLAFADPPYGVDFGYGEEYDDEGGEDYAVWMSATASELQRLATIVLVTPGIRNLWSWPTPTWVLSWHKPGSTRRSDLGGFNIWEPVLMYGKRRIYNDAHRLPSAPNLSSDTGSHPCPKPLRLLTWLVGEASDPGGLVLDPFMGSGTTLRAAKDLGRKAVGIEIEERYCEIAARRMGQGVLALEQTG
jgi:site-specific DNA-methyltransferase (adenine-specific)